MKLPNAEHAVVDIVKLREYSLNPMHPEGKHKARVFYSALGFTINDAERLRQMILQAVLMTEAIKRPATIYGQRFVVDFEATGLRGFLLIRSAWLIKINEDVPRLITCYVL